MIRLVCLLIGYAFGMIQTAFIFGKIKGIDIRTHGSGNAGTTNTLRVFGTKAAAAVLAGDMIKCVLAILLVEALFGKSHPDMIYLLKIYTALGTVIGHDYPFYMHFKGGKGIAASCGMMIAFHWSFIPMFLAAFLIPFNITHYVSLGSLTIYVCFFIELVVEGQLGVYGLSQMMLCEMYVVALIMTLLAFYQHRGNIKKLLTHTERKTYLFKKNKDE